jgi:hypothetical protein
MQVRKPQSLTSGLLILEKVNSQMLAKLFLIACFTILPTCTAAQEVWSKGDKVAAFFICKEEKDIMDLALADSRSREAYAGEVMRKRLSRDCIRFIGQPKLFIVDKVITSYKDYNKIETSIMKIVTPDNMVAGYIVAAGTPSKDKGI